MNETPVAWSISQQLRGEVAREGILHMQGFDFGKPGKTMCGCTFDGNGLWDFDVGQYPPSEFQGCKRCEASYRRACRAARVKLGSTAGCMIAESEKHDDASARPFVASAQLR